VKCRSCKFQGSIFSYLIFNFLASIPAQQTIPCSETRDYTTSEDNQKSITIAIFEGEDPLAEENYFVGEFQIEGLPKCKSRSLKIPVTFTLDGNGLLSVTAKVAGTHMEASLDVTVFNHALSSIDRAKIIQDKASDAKKSEAIQKKQNQLQRLIFCSEYLERTVKDEAFKDMLEDFRGKLELDQVYDLPGSLKLLDVIIMQLHTKPFKQLMNVYIKNCKKLESLKYTRNKDTRSLIKKHGEVLKMTDIEDCSYYYFVRPIMVEVKEIEKKRKES
jgi:molecular chaperone DnaK (HSP70)